MHDLSYYLTLWELTQPEKNAQTFTSDVYKVADSDGRICILKHLNDVGREFEKYGAAYLSYVGDAAAAQVYKHDDGALLLEYAGGGELKALVDAGRDDDATEVAAHVIRALHDGQGCDIPSEFWTMERNAAALFDADDSFHPFVPQAKKVFRALIDTQKDSDIRVLHRDIHHMNILKSERGWLVIDPQPVVGDRHYECTTFFLNPTGYADILNPARVEKIETIFCRVLELDKERLRQFSFCHAMLSACWCAMDEQDPTSSLQFAELIANKFLS